MRSHLVKVLPPSVASALRLRREKRQLGDMPRVECDPSPLRPRSEVSLENTFGSEEIRRCWDGIRPTLDRLGIPDGTGGVNAGDRRAIYYLVRTFRPRRVLEVGTHIGASTVHIAAALEHQEEIGLTTVDVADVNDAVTRPWESAGTEHSPAELVDEIGCGSRVRFVQSPSLDFLSTPGEAFDFIFLDGDHSASSVYREVPAALRRLAAGGVILLHDYYPQLKPLWPQDKMIPGPRLAMERLLSEGAPLEPVPLGDLPWPTKQGKNVTSLALLLKS